MAEKPSADLSIVSSGSGLGAGAGMLTILACVEMNADSIPRQFSSLGAMMDQHGYSPAASLVASFIEETGKPVLLVGMPTVTAGVSGSYDDTGVTGTSKITVAAGANGFLEEVDGVVEVLTGGTIGTNGIQVQVSIDGGFSFKKYRLGTATSLTLPHVGVVLQFAAGTLVADDTFAFRTTAPKWDQAGVQAAREALASQQKRSRSWTVVGDVDTDTEAGYVTTQANAYETSNKRFVYARVNVKDRVLAKKSQHRKGILTGNPDLTFAEVGATGDTITRATGSWITDGFAVGDTVTVTGAIASSGANNVTGVIAALTATVLTFDTTDLVNEGPLDDVMVIGSATLTFAEVGAVGDTITRSSGSWLDDGFAVGDTIEITGAVASSGANNITAVIASLSSTVITLGAEDLVAEVISSRLVTIEKTQTMSDYVSDMDAEFAPVTNQKRIDIGLGRARKECPITGALMRRPVSWAATIREYQHDLHVTTWQKDLNALDGWSLLDADDAIAEYDEETVGGALAAGFTCFRTWPNDEGTFIAQSLTRADENTNLSMTHNMAVTNLFCTVIQKETERLVGRTLVLDPVTGRATPESLQKFGQRVTRAAKGVLLKQGPEGPNASDCKWVPSSDDDLSVPNATLNGVGRLDLRGTIVHVNTQVVVPTGGGT